ncbi:hypothetical protein NB037_03820 [Rathayibacter sp. ZW T2_19]|uniref:Uncharacterized protein n=1 Tax=Rathayibacter rubneri TaxID=2950106 RepID=A0A9X2DZ95_9MICO|nr:hypothetical protein [Rathayibacter rubneri]MCM6761539.1 hypothetical protein [Rathayibacter rubneri]
MSERASGILLRVGVLLFVAVVVLGILVFAARFEPWSFLPTNGALGGVTLVLGTWVPTWLQIELALTGAAVLATLVGFFLLPEEAPPREQEPRSFLAGAAAFILRVLGFLALVIAVPLTLLVTLFQTDSYRVLPGADSAGCRYVERDFAGYGMDVGAVPPGSIVVEWQPYTSECTGVPADGTSVAGDPAPA